MPFEDWMWAIWLGIMIIMVIVDLVCRWGISLISALIILTHPGCNNSMVGASNSVCGCECDHINSVKTVIAEVFEKEQRYQLQC